MTIPPIGLIEQNTPLRLAVAAKIAYPGTSGEHRVKPPSGIKKIIHLVSPGTLLKPQSAIQIAFHCLTEDEITRAMLSGRLPYYIMDDQRFVTLADISQLVKENSIYGTDVCHSLGVIYFAGFKKFVKIGFTSGSIASRLSSLQTSSPEPMKVYATMWGTKNSERDLHLRFADLKIRGEWYSLRGQLRSFITQVNKTAWRRTLFPDPRFPYALHSIPWGGA